MDPLHFFPRSDGLTRARWVSHGIDDAHAQGVKGGARSVSPRERFGVAHLGYSTRLIRMTCMTDPLEPPGPQNN
eukprot:2455837-Amphidinium_carterae.1